MNKTHATLLIVGGAIAVVAVALGVMVYMSYSAKVTAIEGGEDAPEGLESVVSGAERLSKGAVYPCAASVTAVESNRTLVAGWTDEAAKLVARGDRSFEKTTSASFKAYLVGDAKRLVSLQGAAMGKLAKEGFGFGPFRDYISEGKMPEEEKLAEYQRRWDDIRTVVELLAESGIAELTDVQFRDEKSAAEEEQPKAKRKKAKKGAVVADASKAPKSFGYTFALRAKPAALVKSLNALGTSERFIVVDSFSFGRGEDGIVKAIGPQEKGEARASGGRRSRRNRAAEIEKPEEEKLQNGPVTDPATDAPLAVTLNVTVYDFRSQSAEKEVVEK